jgi:hypothetical protein
MARGLLERADAFGQRASLIGLLRLAGRRRR